MSLRWFVGIASASSAEGVDAVLLGLEGIGLDLRLRRLESHRAPYPEEVTRTLRQARRGSVDTAALARTQRLLGETFAAATLAVLDRVPVDPDDVRCIGCPGHGLWLETEDRFPSLLTAGMPAVLAERLGVTVLSEIRARDVAAGGQGVPLSALPDRLLFGHPNEERLLIHLGGMTRVVYLPASRRQVDPIGWEAGPCNGLLDALMRQLTGGKEQFDPGGRHAVQGKCNEPLLAEWLQHPALHRRPPRALAAHLFADDFAIEAVRRAREEQIPLHDLLCTATHFAVRCIGDSLRRWLPVDRPIARVLLSGGGVRNGLLWHRLARHFATTPMERTDVHGVPANVRKATAFGMLAALFLDGVPGNLPSATGAAGGRLLGSLTPGSVSHWARTLEWMSARLPASALATSAAEDW